MQFTRDEVIDTCNEIERQWEYFLMSRAVFPYNLTKSLPRYESPPFYQANDINFIIEVQEPLTEIMNRGLKGIGHWLNQNYIIRLFGILDEKNFITAGKIHGNPFTKIVALLRHQVGSHSRGERNRSKGEEKQVTKLIMEHLDSRVLPDDIQRFNLSIDTVLLPLKNHCVEFVSSREGEEKPKKGKKSILKRFKRWYNQRMQLTRKQVSRI